MVSGLNNLLSASINSGIENSISEKEFNIAIPDEQAENIQTVGMAVSYIEENAK